jgi:hypothetical protein
VRPYLKNTQHKNRAGGVAQGEGLEFKHQYRKKKKKVPYPVICYRASIYWPGLSNSTGREDLDRNESLSK